MLLWMEAIQPNSTKRITRPLIKADSSPSSLSVADTPSPLMTTPTIRNTGTSNNYVTLPPDMVSTYSDNLRSSTQTPPPSYQQPPHPRHSQTLSHPPPRDPPVKPRLLPRSNKSLTDSFNFSTALPPSDANLLVNSLDTDTCPDGPPSLEGISPYVEPNRIVLPDQQNTRGAVLKKKQASLPGNYNTVIPLRHLEIIS